MRLIDADGLSKSIYDNVSAPYEDAVAAKEDCLRAIEEAPTIDAVPVVHGEWIFGVSEVLGTSVRCSVCGWSAPIVDADMWLRYPGHHFCGACGAKMDSESDTQN